MNISLIDILQGYFRRQPNKVAILYGQEKISYNDLYLGIITATNLFISQGVQPNECVLIYARKTPQFIFAYFAIHWLGAIAVPVDPDISKEALQVQIDRINPSVVFYCDNKGEINKNSATPNAKRLRTVKGEQLADIVFTSGTTGEPKGVMLTHGAIMSAVNHINQFIGNTRSDCELITLPFFHSFGLGRMRCVLAKGGSLVLVEGICALKNIFYALEHYHVTGISMVPASIAIFLKLTKDKLSDFSGQINYMEIGSSAMSLDLKKRLCCLLPKTRLCMHYGLTEASRSLFTQLRWGDLKGAGRPAANVQVKFVNDEGSRVATGSLGELCVKGPHLMKGYWLDDKLSQETLIDGWLKTGDRGYQDEEGLTYLVGRNDHMINVSGNIISPIEVEKALVLHDAILDCACVGVECPQQISGKVIKAFVRFSQDGPHPSDQELVLFLRQFLEPYKIPRLYEWVDDIPRTQTGKIQRSLL
jgi:long-chain acyl-CoA synthetase